MQGNLDPLRLVAGGKALAEGVDAILEASRRRTADLQPRSRHHARHAYRACRGLVERVRKGGDADALGQGASRDLGDRLDGGLLYLPRLFVYHCRSAVGSRAVGDLQGDGAAPAARDHQSGDDRDLGVRALAGLATGRMFDGGWLHAKLALVVAMSGVHMAIWPRGVRALRRGSQPAVGALLPDRQRGADRADDRDRHPGDRQAVLTRPSGDSRLALCKSCR